MDAMFKRGRNFVSRSLNESFRYSLEETWAAFGLADLISQRWKMIDKVRFILFSNRVLSQRVDGRKADQ